MPELQFYKTLELFKSYKTEYILTFFLIYGCFLYSLLMVVPSSVSLKPINQLRKIKTKKLRKKLRKSQPNFQHYVKKIKVRANKQFSYIKKTCIITDFTSKIFGFPIVFDCSVIVFDHFSNFCFSSNKICYIHQVFSLLIQLQAIANLFSSN